MQILGILSGVLVLIADIPYILDTINGKTKPHRVTWGIFFLLNALFLANHLAAGAEASLWLVVGFTLATFIIFMLSLKNGVGGTNKSDYLIIGISLMGVALWLLFDSPGLSIAANIFAAFIASIPTYSKSWKQPETETTLSWGLISIASVLTIISVGELNFILLMLPIYSFLFQTSIFLILIRSRLPKLFKNTSV